MDEGHATRTTDNTIGTRLLDRVVAYNPTVTKAWVDAGFKDDVAIHGALRGIRARPRSARPPGGR